MRERGTTSTRKPCTKREGMDRPAYLPTGSLRTSSNRDQKENLRPSSKQPWQSAPGDRLPIVGVQFPRRSQIAGFDLPELKNVKSVRLVVQPSDKNVEKVDFLYTV